MVTVHDSDCHDEESNVRLIMRERNRAKGEGEGEEIEEEKDQRGRGEGEGREGRDGDGEGKRDRREDKRTGFRRNITNSKFRVHPTCIRLYSPV